MKRFLMGFLAIAILVAFTAPSFAGEEKKKEEKKKGGKLIEQIYADGMKKDEKKGEKKDK